jgi:hypothetical protein
MEKLEKRLESMDNLIIKDVLTSEEIDMIYNVIDSCPEEMISLHSNLGYNSYMVSLPEGVRIKIEKLVQEIYGSDWTLNDLVFSRYSKKYGYVPKLHPHFDNTFSDHRITFDLQLFGSKPWPIVIEGVKHTLSDNNALIFSGTSQVHWRENLEFDEEDRFDMVFCHFNNKKDEGFMVTEEWKDYMTKKELDWFYEIEISKDPIKIEK